MMRLYLLLSFIIPFSLMGAPDKKVRKVIYPTKGWLTINPLKESIDTLMLAKADSDIINNQPSVKGILITRNGKIVYEKYYSGFSADSIYNVWSITKSVVSMLTGIALKRNDLDSLSEHVCTLMPSNVTTGINENCREITLAHLMTMTSGLSWYKPGTAIAMRRYEEMDQIFACPPSNAPGSTFKYDGANAHAVSMLLQNTIKKPLNEYAESHLFRPLGIEKYRWEQDNSGYFLGSEGLYLTARDLAKLGYLMMMKGKWDGKQILTEEYYCSSTTQQNIGGFPGYDAYGLLWWVGKASPYETFYALGTGGQLLAVTPALGIVAVIVVDSNHPKADLYKPRQLYYDYIIPAVK